MPPASPDAASPAIRVEHVEKTYDLGATAVRALRGIDLAVQPGEMIAIFGSALEISFSTRSSRESATASTRAVS